MQKNICFTSKVYKGEGKGKSLGAPTMNLDLSNVPSDLLEGVYAVFVLEGETKHPATMHYGARPTLGFDPSCEVHLLGSLQNEQETITVEVIQKLRDVQDFGSEEALKKQIAEDIEKAREALTFSSSEESPKGATNREAIP